jgi:hypothetical protein
MNARRSKNDGSSMFYRMMKATLKDQIDRNNFTHVDDIVVTSKKKCNSPENFVFNGRRNLHPTSVMIQMKWSTPELGAKDLITNLNFLLLVIKLIVLHKDLCYWLATVGRNNPAKFRQLDNSIGGQLMQLNLEFHYYLH